MGYSLAIQNMNDLFHQSSMPPLIINKFKTDSDEDKRQLTQLLYTRYKGDTLDVLPSCNCGLLKDEYNVGIVCDNCGTEVRSVTERPLESSLWMAPPEGVSCFISPIMWIILSGYLKHSGQNLLEWMCSPTYQPNGPANRRLQKLQDVYQQHALERSLNTFEANFDKIFELLIQYRLIKGKKNQIEDLVTFITKYRDCIFCGHLPLTSRLGFITEDTVTGRYADVSMTLALDAALTITGTVHSNIKVSYKVRQARTVMAIAKLSEFYSSFIANTLGKKHGLLRKHLFGSRLHFSARAVISSLSENHKYDECYLPWSLSVLLFKTHLTAKLIQTGVYTPNDCIKFIHEHTLKYHPLMDQLFQELIAEAPLNDHGDGGIPIILQRNPSLQRGSAQLLRVTKIKTDISVNSISMSTLCLKAPN